LPGPALALIVMAMVVGAIRGVATLLQATAVSDRWGAASYGALSGVLTAPVMTAMAVAPWAGAALATVIGYPSLFVVLAGVGAVGAGVASWSTPADGGLPGGQQQRAVASAVTAPSGSIEAQHEAPVAGSTVRSCPPGISTSSRTV